MRNRRTLLFIIGFSLVVAFITFCLYYDHIHFNHLKGNIFEIPGTYSLWKGGNIVRYEKYYFIQKPPNEEQELCATIETFIKENNVLVDAKNSGADYVALSFMIPNYTLPIYFEEDKNYYKMDDYIKNYINSNRIVLYTYVVKNNESDYMISKN